MMSTTRTSSRLRERATRILVEIVSVVFAVLVALGVDEWRQARQDRERAEAARTAVLAELRSNRDELERSAPSIDSLLARLPGVRDGVRRGEPETLQVRVDLPDFSDAAWETAQMTQATAHMELPWLIRVARAYQAQRLYSDLRTDVVRTFTGINSGESAASLGRLAGQLQVLRQLGRGLEAKYDTIFASGTG